MCTDEENVLIGEESADMYLQRTLHLYQIGWINEYKQQLGEWVWRHPSEPGKILRSVAEVEAFMAAEDERIM